MERKPVQIALYNDSQVIAQGLKSMLAPFEDRVALVEEEVETPGEGPIDLTLIDTCISASMQRLDETVFSAVAGQVVAYSWNMHPRLVEDALSRGYRGYLSKELVGKDLVKVLERIDKGEVVVSPDPHVGHATTLNHGATWPGRDDGLSRRESDMIVMIVDGYTNNEIAEGLYIGINSVKSYIRTAYRKIQVERRSQAVRWGLENGMAPVRERLRF